MSRFLVVFALCATILVTSFAQAAPGPVPTGTAMADYDPVTGQIVVSVSGVNNWFVMDGIDNVFTGDEPLGLPVAGYLVSNNDNVIGETSSNLSDTGLFGYTDLNLGNVAQTGLVNDGSLSIYWNAGMGQPLQSQPINFSYSNLPPAPSITSFAQYDIATGEITVSVDGVNNWYLASASSGLSGDAPSSLLGSNGLVSDNDSIIGETSLDIFSVADLNLGNVAQPGLALGDLSLFWNEGLGSPLQMRPVDYFGDLPFATVEEPTSGDDSVPADGSVPADDPSTDDDLVSVFDPHSDDDFIPADEPSSDDDIVLADDPSLDDDLIFDHDALTAEWILTSYWYMNRNLENVVSTGFLVSGSQLAVLDLRLSQLEYAQPLAFGLDSINQTAFALDLQEDSQPLTLAPEPTAFTMFAIGLLGIGCFHRKRS